MSKDKTNDLAAALEATKNENAILMNDLAAARQVLAAYEPPKGTNRFRLLFPLDFCMIRGVVGKPVVYRDGTIAYDVASVNVPLATMGYPEGTGMTIPGVRIVYKVLPHGGRKVFDVVFPSSGSMNTFKHSMLKTDDDEAATVAFGEWKRDLLTKFLKERKEAAARGETLINYGTGKGIDADDALLAELGITIAPPTPKPAPSTTTPTT